MMEGQLANLTGIFGVVVVLIAYGLLQVRKINPRAIPFSLMNLTGSVCIVISLWVHWNVAAFVMEVAWIVISGYGLYGAVVFHLKKTYIHN